jgi:hypothetical protein
MISKIEHKCYAKGTNCERQLYPGFQDLFEDQQAAKAFFRPEWFPGEDGEDRLAALGDHPEVNPVSRDPQHLKTSWNTQSMPDIFYVRLLYDSLVNFQTLVDNTGGAKINRLMRKRYSPATLEAKCWRVFVSHSLLLSIWC